MANNSRILVSAAAISLLALATACGGDDSSSGGKKRSSAPTANTGTPLGPTGPGSVPATSSDGTSKALTTDQVKNLREAACNGFAQEPEGGPSKLELVIDISSSMSDKAPGSNNLTKWQVTRDALREAVVGVTGPGLSANTAVGLLFFPGKVVDNNVPTVAQPDSASCLNTEASAAMDLLGGKDGAQRISLDKTLRTVELGRGTPTHDAYVYALENVVLGAAQEKFQGQPYMLLITDGMPTLEKGCFNKTGELTSQGVPTQPIIDAIADAQKKGVKTFIIGSPGSEEGRNWLSAAARAGGTASEGCSDNGPKYCHMDMTKATDFSLALREGLSQVMNTINDCKFQVPTESSDGTQKVDVAKVNPIVYYGDKGAELLGRDGTGDCTKTGFRLNSDTELELCKETCAKYQADSTARIELLFGCSATDVGGLL